MSYGGNNNWKRKGGSFGQGGGPKRSFSSAFNQEESVSKNFEFNSRSFILNDDDSLKLCTNGDCGQRNIPVSYRISQNGNTIYDYECSSCQSKFSVTAVEKMKHLLEQTIAERLGGNSRDIELYKKLANNESCEPSKKARNQTASPEPSVSIVDSVSKKLDQILESLNDLRDVMMLNDVEYRQIFKSIEENGEKRYKLLNAQLTKLVLDMNANKKIKDTTKSMLESQPEEVNPSLSPLRLDVEDVEDEIPSSQAWLDSQPKKKQKVTKKK